MCLVPMDLDVKMKALTLGATFLIVRIRIISSICDSFSVVGFNAFFSS